MTDALCYRFASVLFFSLENGSFFEDLQHALLVRWKCTSLCSGRIEFDEFVEVVADSYFKKFTRAEILDAFRRFDHNRDGFIEADELKGVLAKLGRNFSNDEVNSKVPKVEVGLCC